MACLKDLQFKVNRKDTNTMHILIATPEFITEDAFSGGLANCVADFARIYARKGNRVTIVTLSTKNKRIEWEQGIIIYGVKADEYTIKERLINIFFPYYPLYKRINKKIKEISGSEEISIIHYPSSYALTIGRPKDVPAVVMMSTYLPIFREVYKPEFNINKRNIKSRGRLEKQIRRSIKKADTIFAPSKIVAKYGELDTGKKIAVVESPVLVDEYVGESILKDEKLKGKKYFLFFGTLGYLKGIALIAKVLQGLFEYNKDICFVFLGEQTNMGTKKNPLMAMDYVYSKVPKKYHFRIIYKEKTRDKFLLYSIVSNAVACVLPSRFDNLPNTCIEAMALGKVVIGTKKASFDELITDNVNGFLIDVDNEEQLLEKLKQILKMSGEQLQSMGENARKIIKRLDPETIYPQLMQFYQYTINEYKRKKGDGV